jgi:hypothetical protein
MNAHLKKILLIAAEVTLVVIILALIAANWIPVVVGAHPTRVSPTAQN